MPNIKPVSDLRNYTEVLKSVSSDSPVFLTKNGRGCYVILEMQEYERKEAALKLMKELEKGRISGEKEGWHSLDEIKKEFIISKPIGI
ncbi:MAG: type II toxin-antitoxin system prevent-host-death family antitoxin [Treponema sp.]|nr:type II toxin-antitoxin system prevent-host-death family antitoxin [Treponema sp.]